MTEAPVKAGDRCGTCPACIRLERAKRIALSGCNPPFTHANDMLVQAWNNALILNPCETWEDPDAEAQPAGR